MLAAQLITWWALLSLLHEDISNWLKALLVVFFCLMMQGVFSFMHEAFHGHAHPDKRTNRLLGIVSSTIFGTSYTLFRINHIGHHARNRTRAELVDYIYPDEAPLRKILLYYTGILGGIWLGGFLGALLLPLLPYGTARKLAANSEANSFLTAFKDFESHDWNMMRVELAFGLVFWVAAILLFDWRWSTLLTAYAAFALSWSWLQWVYHVRSPIDVIEGAYNLRVATPVRWLFLNFNYNLTHHRDSSWHWQELHAVSDPAETQPLWYRTINMVFPPQRLPDDVTSIKKVHF